MEDYYDDGSGKQPRCYPVNAVNSTVEVIATGQNRTLLIMATLWVMAPYLGMAAQSQRVLYFCVRLMAITAIDGNAASD
ncbi:hypothetical protein [Novosphingobium sediminicola]|uniref:Uncharacterized protein n=1 Tax=Novosphingobium sediminicola TaxID=563162 RepID=A0A7W6CGK3_9SPHN|nr:hypothetical protein [Novosphingobium sediminicola]MBB3956129.1 hypothetical protein [Novosphingobium sediminicola]